MNIAEQVIRAKQDLDDVYTAGQSSMVDPDKLIPKTVSGSYISVDDVSEIPHSVGCKVESVNLFDNPTIAASGTSKGITWTLNEDKSVTLNGTSTATVVIYYQSNLYLKAGTYTLNSNLNVPNGSVYVQTNKFVEDTGVRAANSDLKPATFELTEDNTKTTTFIGILPNTTLDNVTICPMLNKDTTALPYTPYVKPEEVNVTRCGRNLLNPNNLGDGELVEYNGVLCYKGSETSKVGNPLVIRGCFKPNTQYTFTSKSYRKSSSPYNVTVIYIRYTDGTSDSDGYVKLGESETIVSTAGKTIDRIGYANYGAEIVYLDLSVSCLYEGTTALPYEPYNGQTLTPTADGTVEGMTSVSPYMNVFSDTEGVNIEVTYNKSWGMQTEYDRFWDVFQNYGKRDNYYVAFFAGNLASSCWNNDNFKPKYPIKPVNAQNMFCNINIEGDLTQIADIDFSNATNVAGSINYCPRITRIGVIDLRKVTTNGLSLVSNCAKLATIDEIIFKNDGSQYSGASGMVFTGCTALKNLIITGKINFNFNTQPCPLSKASITSVINALYEGSSGQTLTLKLSAVNTAFETSSGAADGSTSAEFAALVATKTNWTITMI